jgi:hypothetical protein
MVEEKIFARIPWEEKWDLVGITRYDCAAFGLMVCEFMKLVVRR